MSRYHNVQVPYCPGAIMSYNRKKRREHGRHLREVSYRSFLVDGCVQVCQLNGSAKFIFVQVRPWIHRARDGSKTEPVRE
ncbi:hypothetical protein L596_007251 [Steinernema carpocapsae]|uniref:Uncharacterized protein n=1 Tax=Steinernema carpocapsae TaxID=34508 RepID=A0A4V6A615_STECR|nr:hypothetical protein L596_007251 [Steinernema carpocapsae]